MRMLRMIAMLLLCCLVLPLVACGDANEQEETTPQETTTQSTVPNTPQKNDLKILFGKTANYQLVCENGMTGIWDFPQLFEEKTGIKTTLRYALESEGENEILLGSIKDRADSLTLAESTSYVGYQIKFVGERLLISANSTEQLKEAFNAFLDALVQNEAGEWGIPKDIHIQNDPATVADNIPKLDPKKGELKGVYSCYDDHYQLIFQKTSKDVYETYTEALEKAGFALYAENMIGDNLFATYVTEQTVVRVQSFKADKSMHVIYGKRTYLPATAAPTGGTLPPCVTQIGRTGATQGAAGMSYIVQATDGSFLVFDGGPFDQSDTKKLMTYLNANKPAAHQKPRVTWFISHLHSDHVDLSIDFLKKYSNDIDLQMLCWGIPDFDFLTLPNESTENAIKYQTEYEALLAKSYPGAKIYNFYTGDRMLFPGIVLDVMVTYNDLWPTQLKDLNETSAMLRLTFESGKTFLVTGDTYPVSCNWSSKIYGENLHCDIVQTPHHGRVGSTAQFYRNVTPSIVLWSNAKKYLDPNYSDNAYSRDHNTEILADASIQHYHSEYTTVIDMTDLSVTVFENFIWTDASQKEEETLGATFRDIIHYDLSKPFASAPLTIEAVISLPKALSGRGGVILGNYKESGGACYSVEIFNNGAPRLYVITSTGKVIDVKFTEVDIRSEGFVHLSVVLDVANSKALCYVDGVLKQTASVTVTGELTYTELHKIGSDHRSGYSQYFKGTIQSVAAYSDVRTAEEIKADMNKIDTSDANLLVAFDFTRTPLEETWKDLSQNHNHIDASKG